jgi:hypothetical protein
MLGLMRLSRGLKNLEDPRLLRLHQLPHKQIAGCRSMTAGASSSRSSGRYATVAASSCSHRPSSSAGSPCSCRLRSGTETRSARFGARLAA